MKPTDWRSDSWFQIVVALRRGDRPSPEDIAAALRRGEHIPKEGQNYLAGLVDGSQKKKGASSKWSDPFSYVTFRRQIDKARQMFEDGVLDKGKLTPTEAAYELIGRKEYGIDPSTAKKYSAKGGRLIEKFSREGWPRVLLGLDGLPVPDSDTNGPT